MFSSVNTCWTLVGAFLVYFMQAGFALCEAGFTRAKNTGNILMKNMMDFCIGTPCYWIIGFGLMFGGTGALIGGFDPFIQGDYSHLGLDIPLWVYIVFQTVFCATAATIVSGSMAERTNNTYQRVYIDSQRAQIKSDYYVEDLSYMRMKNLELGYTFPKSLVGKIGISGIRVFVSAQNLFTLTRYKGFDPERAGVNATNIYDYPLVRTFTAGLNVTF